MSNTMSAYLAFNGDARRALQFYAEVFGGNPEITTFADMHTEGMPNDGVMHGQLQTSDGWTIMAADSTMPGDEVVRGGTTLCVWGDDLDAGTAQFQQLAAEGKVNMPLAKQPWGDSYGDVTDKFGITWGFNLSGN